MSTDLARKAHLLSAEIAETGYTHIWYRPRVVRLLHRAQGGACAICGVDIPVAASTLDHVVPISRGGANDLTNFLVTCELCNHEKGDGPAGPHQLAVHRQVLDLLGIAGGGG